MRGHTLENRPKNIAIILASGTSERLNNLNTVKQFVKIAGKTVIEHTLDVFEKNTSIDEIIIVTREEYKNYCFELIQKNNFKKIKNIINGGKTRRESSFNALSAINCNENDNILIHDAVRPFVSDKIINDCMEALEKYQAVDVAIPSADTIIEINDNNLITNIPKRKYLRRGQTPQAFKFGIIKKAHILAEQDKNIEVTDDCGLIKKFNLAEVFVVGGDDFNIKITYPIDIDIADKLFQIKSYTAKKTKPDTLKNKVIVIFGSSKGIGKEIFNLAEKHKAKVYGYSRSSGVDISCYNQVEKALQDVFLKEKRIDAVINTAGVLKTGSLEERDINDIISEINVNYTGSVNIAKLSIPYLKKTKGNLILFASSSYTRGRKNYSIYSSAKAAIVNLTQALAEEEEEYGIKINVINPERTKTPMRRENFGKEPDETLLTPEHVAKVTLETLLSDFSGQIINVRKSH